ncbi:type II toxin-antitoxin system RelE/ParE family toxin [Campylobacter coli]|nr:type II toxin-antitoxin system RelE/ParE family toxin [Campylobacter coli]
MVIHYSDEFLNDLKNIADYISLDSKDRALIFIQQVKTEIQKIPTMPYRYRKNKAINKENIRDLIFKGYIIPFSISDKYIEILAIFKHNITAYSK